MHYLRKSFSPSRRRVLSLAVIAISLWAAPSAAVLAQTDELVVIVNPSNKVQKIASAELEKIFTTVRNHWDTGESIVVFNPPPKNEIRVQFDQIVLGMDADQVGRFWVDRKVRGGAAAPRQVADPAMIVRLVAKMPGAIAYVPATAVDANVRVVEHIKTKR